MTDHFHFDEDGNLLVYVDALGTHDPIYQYPPFLFNENYALLCGFPTDDIVWVTNSDLPMRDALGNKFIFTAS